MTGVVKVWRVEQSPGCHKDVIRTVGKVGNINQKSLKQLKNQRKKKEETE